MKIFKLNFPFSISAMWFVPALVLLSSGVSGQKNIEPDESPQARFNHVISGTATFLPDSVPFEGLVISFSEVGETIVAVDGTYTMEVPRHWSGVATPYLCGAGGYTFDPPDFKYVDVQFDFTDQDYTGEATTSYIISGRFTDKATGEPLANTQVKFNLTGMNQVEEMYVTTNELGEYSFEKLPCWGDTLDPYLSGYYYFEPMKRGYAELGSDLANQDFEVLDYAYPLPPDWETINTGSFAFIAIENTADPDICGQPIEVGDLLGVFYTDDNGELKCGGYTRWQDETNGFISTHGDDNTTPEKDGFTGGEPYTWLIYSYNTQQSNPASVELVSGNNSFLSLGLTKVGEVDGLLENQIFIDAGWSGISSYTMPDVFPALITNIADPILEDLVILQDMEKVYYPAAGINTMILWKYNQGYKIKLNADAVLPMNGCPEEDRTVNLDATWNIMPVLSSCAVPVSELFEPVADNLMMVKEIAGTGIYWPEMNIQTLHLLLPGKAYFVAVSQNTAVDFSECTSTVKMGINPATFKNNTSWEDPEKTATSHIFAIGAAAMADFNSGDCIGAFTGAGICAGLAEVRGDQGIALTVFGDDPFTSGAQGFTPGEEIAFRVFNSNTGEEALLEPVYDPGFVDVDGTFSDQGISKITGFISSTSSVIMPEVRIHVSPNPAHDHVAIQLNGSQPTTLTVNDLRGTTMFQKTIRTDITIDLSKWPSGIYMVTAESRNARRVAKLVVD